MSSKTTTPKQLTLLSDHIKLSLLERQRATSLNLPANSHDAEISRSLDSFREGLEYLEQSSTSGSANTSSLRRQYNYLLHQFNGTSPPSSSSNLKPSNPALASDYEHATTTTPSSKRLNKSVRFTDNPAEEEEEQRNRASLMPYSDNPTASNYRDEDAAPDHSELSNQQIHTYHSQVLRQQDDQLDVLGQSISRQRELSIHIGDELDEQAEMLTEMDDGVSRHQGQLDRGRQRLGKIARKAKDNWSMLTIAILILILLLLIIVLK